MRFYISFKYSTLSILKSKTFISTTSISFGLAFLLNLILGILIINSGSEMKKLHFLQYADIVLLLIPTVVLGILFSNELFYSQKKNGIKTIEVKSGLKIWQIFISKLSSLLVILFVFSTLLATMMVIQNLIVYKNNIYVTKLLFINLYLIFFVSLFLVALNLLFLCLNLQKITMIFSSFFLGILSLFALINSLLYDYVNYADQYRGSNIPGTLEYQVYFNYYIKNFKDKNSNENKVVSELNAYREDDPSMQNIVWFDDIDNDYEAAVEYYNNFLEENYFYSSGALFQNIDFFNEINKYFFQDQSNYSEAKYDENLINRSVLFKAMSDFDTNKTRNDAFAPGYAFDSPTTLVELQDYVNKFEKMISSKSELNGFSSDLKKLNKLVLEMYKKLIYLDNQRYFLENQLGIVSGDVGSLFVSKLKESATAKQRKLAFDAVQPFSSAKAVYQGILFYIINNFDEDKLIDVSEQIDTHLPSGAQMSNYYTSPFLWLEFLGKFGFVKKTFDNVQAIQATSFYFSNNFFTIDYSEERVKDSVEFRYVITDYKYKGPNTALLLFMTVVYSSILIGVGYIFYRLNFYK